MRKLIEHYQASKFPFCGGGSSDPSPCTNPNKVCRPRRFDAAGKAYYLWTMLSNMRYCLFEVCGLVHAQIIWTGQGPICMDRAEAKVCGLFWAPRFADQARPKGCGLCWAQRLWTMLGPKVVDYAGPKGCGLCWAQSLWTMLGPMAVDYVGSNGCGLRCAQMVLTMLGPNGVDYAGP